MSSRPSRILSKNNLKIAWHASRDGSNRPGAKGTDDQSAKAFAQQLESNIESLHSNIAKGTFGFSKLRPVKVPKSTLGKYRLICVPTVRDRLVQRAIALHLNKEGKLPCYPASVYGFVSDGGVRKAVDEVCKLREHYPWVYETDIQKFFDSIDRDILKKRVKTLLKNSSLVPLIDNLISTDISDKYDVKLDDFGLIKGRGLRQGMPLSPLLSNIALRKFDQALEKAGIKAIRYVDDIVCFAKSKNEALEIDIEVRKLLLREGLEIPTIEENTKTHIAHSKKPVEFLGWSVRFQESSSTYRKYVSDEKLKSIRSRLNEFSDVESQIKLGKDLTSTLRSLTESSNAYRHTYKEAENRASVLQAITQTVQETKQEILINLFGTAAVEKLSQADKEFIGLDIKTNVQDH